MTDKYDIDELREEIKRDEAVAVAHAPLLPQKDINRLVEEHRARKEKAERESK